MEIKIPNPERSRALILIDLQRGFVNQENIEVIRSIRSVIQNGKYDCIVEATFKAEVGSLWDKQVGFTFAEEPTMPEIRELLNADSIRVEKSSKSAFKGNVDLASLFRGKGIEEVHVVGIDTHDCVLATAEESFDFGFFTYVIEECTASSVGNEFKEKTLDILREVEMTNHSKRIPMHLTIHA